MTYIINGYSDDIVEINNDDEYNSVGCYNEDVQIEFGDKESGGVVVEMSYEASAVWCAKIHQIAEDVLCPWNVRVEFEGFSPYVYVDAPHTVKFRVSKRPETEYHEWQDVHMDEDDEDT